MDTYALFRTRLSVGGTTVVNTDECLAALVVSGRFLCLILLSALLCYSLPAQSVAEAAGATSISSVATTNMKPAIVSTIPPPATAPATSAVSPHVLASTGPAPEETNRRAFAENAGKDASKLLLRSTLPESRIWINGKPVGKTPMLFVLPPGKYQVEVVGPHAERTQSAVALLPHETRELTLKLEARYPNRVTVH